MIATETYRRMPRVEDDSSRTSPVELDRRGYMVPRKRHIRQWGLWEGEVDGQEDEETTRITRAGRALRNRRYRRAIEDARRTKRLFTPEIKKFLKGWLVRRRNHPYPNRSEKKDLALQTGLTYMQICNWFANWRRKLKKGFGRDMEVRGDTWGLLITGYNRQAQGNVEQFSISSDDSIWDEANYNQPRSHFQTRPSSNVQEVSRGHMSSKPEESPALSSVPVISWAPPAGRPTDTAARDSSAPVLLKWLESAARFRPREACWSDPAVSWSRPVSRRSRAKHRSSSVRGRHREELDAAEALTFLSTSSTLAQCV